MLEKGLKVVFLLLGMQRWRMMKKRTYEILWLVTSQVVVYFLDHNGKRTDITEGPKAPPAKIWGGSSSLFCWVSLLSPPNQKGQPESSSFLTCCSRFLFFATRLCCLLSDLAKLPLHGAFHVYLFPNIESFNSCLDKGDGDEVRSEGQRDALKEDLHASTAKHGPANVSTKAEKYVSITCLSLSCSSEIPHSNSLALWLGGHHDPHPWS